MLTWNTLVHRGKVYVIEGDIFLLSQTALKDLGVIPTTFPRIGEFGGIEQQGDGWDRFEVDGPYNIRYIEVEQVMRTTAVDDEIDRNMVDNLRTNLTKIDSAMPSILPSTRRMRPRI